jgi:chromatin-remodeling ATPase INO80
MSFASILSEPATERPPRRSSPPPIKLPRNPEPAPVAPVSKPQKKLDRPRRVTDHEPWGEKLSASPAIANGLPEPIKPPPQPRVIKSRKALAERGTEAMNKVMPEVNTDNSDVEEPGFEAEWERYVMKGKKRALDIDRQEAKKCKVGFRYWILYLSFFSFIANQDIATST